ncbi:MAG: hypothetical protein V4582_23225 [Pseudomonadota bacterium]
MSKLMLITAILWGSFVAGFGLDLIDPGSADTATRTSMAQQAVVMLSAGMATVLVGLAGLADRFLRPPGRRQ